MYLLIILCVSLYFIWRLVKKRSPLEPPEISGKLPFIGHGYIFLGNSEKVYKSILKISAECTEKGGVTTMKIGPRTIYFVSDPEDCLTISNSCVDKDYLYKIIEPFFGNALILAKGSVWKNHRRLIDPAFNRRVLNTFMDIFNRQARDLIEEFDQKIGEPFEQDHLLRLNNLKTICLTSIGLEGEEYIGLQDRYHQLTPIALSLLNERFSKFWLHNDFFYNFSQLKRNFDRTFTELKKLAQKFVKAKLEEMDRNEFVGKREKPGKFKPFLELMLEIKTETGSLTEEEIRQETDGIIVGGHDTTASLLTIALTLLGSHVDVQDKIYKEVIEALEPDIERDINKNDIAKLVYTEAFIKETLRLYPIAPIFARFADKPIKLKNYTIKANSGCYLSIAGINRLPIWGPDVDQFRPERWLDTASLPDPNYFGVFGMGRRSCIGKVYAMMSMKLYIAHIVRRYRIQSDASKMVLIWQIMTRPGDGHYISLEKRKP